MTKSKHKMVLKHFGDLKMHSPGLAQMIPQDHPASKYREGAQLMQPTDMAAGHTGEQLSKNLDHANIQD